MKGKVTDNSPASHPVPLALAWYAVALLCIIYLFSFADRLILGILVEPIQQELGIGDTEMGILNGFAFGFPYAVAVILFARIADNGNRKRLIVGSTLLWSVCSAMQAFAPNFATLCAFRVGVGVGEAILSPAALSLIADLFRDDKRSFPVSLFLASGLIGSNGVFVVAGALLAAFTLNGVPAIPVLAGLAPWRAAVLVISVPALLILPLFLFGVREPERAGIEKAGDGTVSLATVWQFLMDNRGFYGNFLIALGLAQMITYSLAAWLPTMVIRTYEVGEQSAGLGFGLVGFLGGFAGSILVPAWAQTKARKGHKSVFSTVAIAAVAAAVALLVAALLVPSMIALFVLLLPAIFFLIGAGTIAALSIQLLAPNRMRAQITAIYLVGANVMGLALAPVIVAAISDLIGGQASLQYGMLILVVIVGPIALWLLNRSRYHDPAGSGTGEQMVTEE